MIIKKYLKNIESSIFVQDMSILERFFYRQKYGRCWDRVFDNQKIKDLLGDDYKCLFIRNGLTKCLNIFIKKHPDPKIQAIVFECLCIKKTHEKTSLKEISILKQKMKYLICRYTPYLHIKLQINNATKF